MEGPRYIDAETLADYISVSRSSLPRLIKDGVLPAPIDLTDKIKRWDREAVDAKLAGTAQSPTRTASDVARETADEIAARSAQRRLQTKKAAGRR